MRMETGENTSQKKKNDRYLVQSSHKIDAIKIHVEVKTTERTSCKFGARTSTLLTV